MTTEIDVSRLQARDLSPLIGSEVRASKEQLLGGELAEDLRQLLFKRSVLVFPRVHFNDTEQKAFTAILGEFQKEIWGEEVYKVTQDTSLQNTAAYLRGTIYWHIDGTMNRDKVPNLASILSCKAISSSGGETQFCNTYAAYEALSDEDKAAINGLEVVHLLASGNLMPDPEPSYELWREWLDVGKSVLPMVWRHASGRRSLVVGATAHHVIGMDPLDGHDLLIRMRDWASQPQFVYSHKWSVGDAVIWDNTGSMHRATPYDPKGGRLLHRTKIKGEEVIA